MKLFQAVQKDIKLLGFIRNHGGYRYYPLSIRHLVATAHFLIGIFMVFLFVVHFADSPEEYMDSFYILIMIFTTFTSFMTTILAMTRLFDFFDSYEKVSDMSKFNSILFKSSNVS